MATFNFEELQEAFDELVEAHKNLENQDAYNQALKRIFGEEYECVADDGREINDYHDARKYQGDLLLGHKNGVIFVSPKKQPEIAYAVEIKTKGDKLEYKMDPKPVSMERYEKEFLPEHIANLKPEPLGFFQKLANRIKSGLGFGPTAAKKQYDEEMREYTDKLEKSAKMFGVLTEEKKSEIRAEAERAERKAALEKDQPAKERAEMEIRALKYALSPKYYGFMIGDKEDRRLRHAESAYTKDWKPSEEFNQGDATEWKLFREFAADMVALAQDDPEVRRGLALLNGRAKHEGPQRFMKELYNFHRNGTDRNADQATVEKFKKNFKLTVQKNVARLVGEKKQTQAVNQITKQTSKTKGTRQVGNMT